MDVLNKIGRRKKAIARIYLKDGKGKITINPYGKYTFIIRQIRFYFHIITLLNILRVIVFKIDQHHLHPLSLMKPLVEM